MHGYRIIVEQAAEIPRGVSNGPHASCIKSMPVTKDCPHASLKNNLVYLEVGGTKAKNIPQHAVMNTQQL
jgi:hypothetical protein